MRYASIRKMDIVNGPGVRVSVFTQGCNIHCDGCFSTEIWSFDGGKEFTEEIRDFILDLCDKPHIAGLSILGGEPLSTLNYNELLDLIMKFRERFPDKTIWMWTGYIFEELNNTQLDIVKMVDVLVDGPWTQNLGDFSLKYRGSSNQRVIDIRKTFEQNKVILKEI